MYMKNHILGALREELAHWEKTLAELSVPQINTPTAPTGWSIKDEIAHLWAWQQRSIARMEAAQHERPPQLPMWSATLETTGEAATDKINAWICDTYRAEAWPVVYERWHTSFLHFLGVAETIAEKDLLDAGRYPWLNGFPLVLVLTASYDHHQEHLEKLLARLQPTQTDMG